MGGALLFALDNINSNDSILMNSTLRFNLQLSYCNKRRVLSKTSDLILSKNVNVVIGDACSVTSEFAGLLASEYNLPFITFSSSNANIDDRQINNTLTIVKGSLEAVGDVIIQVPPENGFLNICLYSSSRGFLVFIERGIDTSSMHHNVLIIQEVNHGKSEDLRPAMVVLKQNCRGIIHVFLQNDLVIDGSRAHRCPLAKVSIFFNFTYNFFEKWLHLTSPPPPATVWRPYGKSWSRCKRSNISPQSTHIRGIHLD